MKSGTFILSLLLAWSANGQVGYVAHLYSGSSSNLLVIPSTNSFQLLFTLENAAQGTPSLTTLTNSLWLGTNFPSVGVSYNNDNDTNFYSVSSLHASAFPSNFWWNSAFTNVAGVRTLAILVDSNTATSKGIQVYLHKDITPFSFGFYFTQNMTNTSPGTRYEDVLYWKEDIGAGNTEAVRYNTLEGAYETHSTCNSVTLYGPFIYGTSPGDTVWVTGEIQTTNWTLAIYNPTTWVQIGTNSSLGKISHVENAFEFMAYVENGGQDGCTNYFGPLVVDLYAHFPLLPTNFPAIHYP